MAILCLQKFERGSKADGIGDSRCAGFETQWRRLEFRAIPLHARDHFAAVLPGLHGLQMFMLAVQHANAGRAVKFVPGADQKIAIQLPDIETLMHSGLRRIHQHRHARDMGDAHNIRHRRQRAQHIGHGGDGEKFDACIQQGWQHRQIQFAIFLHRDHAQRGAGFLRQLLPGQEIGVMFERADDNGITRLQTRRQKTLRHQIDRFGAAACPDNLIGLGGVEKLRDLPARRFKLAGDLRGLTVRGAMHVGHAVAVVREQRINHGLRFLRRRGAVQIHPVRLRGKAGKKRTERIHGWLPVRQ